MTDVIYGINPVREALLHTRERVERVAMVHSGTGGRLKEIRRLAQRSGIKVENRTARDLDAMAEGGRHQGVVLFSSGRKAFMLQELLDLLQEVEAPLLIMLDGITDPRNLGAIIRSAEVLGANGIVMGKDRAARIGPTVVKASAGASEIVPMAMVVNIPLALEELKKAGYWVVGTASDAPKRCFQYDWTVPSVLVVGAEGKGMRRLVREKCDEVVSIPVKGRIESLNVASATSIILYEILKQREAAESEDR